ncbi:TenA family protein [Loktanella sp. TSTF-M6]|uniref:Aminopyrimidine aminohydrolase n=1 Tax=Loktanella gaetbuli TaxID=2881335 RepID=A0ABS8BXR1_9RHOB|nr:TenA family protein [Loktanella gaetbuli]MCB5200484.1 TenA family protein [Loktanella gaetbuli]
MLLSDRILSANDAVLNRMLKHRFVADIQVGGLDKEVFHRYLAYEGQFVETAISIFAFATIKAPDITARRWLIGVQDALANTQVPYFEEIFARRGIVVADSMPLAVTAFDAGMLDIARAGSFLDVLTAMFAAEWMYWTWCRNTNSAQITDLDLRAWVDMHTATGFADQALWLKQAIDTYGAETDGDRLCAIFDQVTQLEIDFHTAAYRDTAQIEGS